MTTPAISVLMTVWNTPLELVRAAVASIGKPEAEVLIVDDGSTDPGLRSWLNDLAHHRPWQGDVLLRDHAGVGGARNAGLRLCRAPFVTLLGADDIMPEGRLAAQVAFMEAHPEIDVVGGQMLNCGPDMRPINRTHYALQPGPVAPQYVIADGTVCYRKDVILRVGGYDERPWRGCDFRLWQALDAAGARFAVVDDIWLHRRVWPGSYSFSRSKYLQTLHRQWQETA